MPLKNIVIMRKYAHILASLLLLSLLFSTTASAGITYDAGNNIITVTGYTESSPCTFTDIYNEDVANSWGVVSMQCDNQFCIDAGVEIGDGSTATWFKDTNKLVRFTAYTVGVRDAMTAMSLGNIQIGEVMDATNKLGKNGCELYFAGVLPNLGITAEGSGNLKIYNSFLTGEIYYGSGSSYNGHTGNLTVWTSKIDHALYIRTADTDIFGNTINQNQRANSYGAAMWDSGTIPKISIFGAKDRGALSFYGSGVITAKDVYIRDCDHLAILWGKTGTYNIINADTDVWTIYRYYSGSEIVQKQFEFDLKVIDKDNVPIDNATVKIWDKDSNLIVDTTTNASGVITTQTLTAAICEAGTSTFNLLKTPHRIKVEKAGYTAYEADFTLEEKTDWTIALQISGGGTANTTYALIGTATPLGARKTTMVVAFVLLSGMFMMMLAKRYKEDEQDVT